MSWSSVDPRVRYFYKTWYWVPFLVPAWDRGEIEAALWPRRGSTSSGDDDPYRRLKEELAGRFGFQHVVLTSSGSFALEVALRALERPGEVVLPTLICGSVVRAVIRAGCVPVPADVNDDLTLSADSVEARLTNRTVAVVVAHLSGTPALDLDRLIALCDRRNLSLIDDAAQAVGIRANGRFLGSCGRFGILSFGLGKPTFSIGGGALITSSPQDAARCEEIVRRIDEEEGGVAAGRAAALRFVLEYCWRRYTLPVFMAQRALARMLRLSPRQTRRGRMDRLSATVQAMQIRKIDRILERFRVNGEIVIDRLRDRADVTFPQHREGTGYTKLLVSLERGDVRDLAARLLRRGVEVEWSYQPFDLRPEFAAYRRNSNVRAESVWTRLVALPNHPGLSNMEAAYVADATTGAIERT